jgi:hypothetical protein
MAKFLCVTQIQNMANYSGPSGVSYTSLRGIPFNVISEIDVAYFDKKKQFEKVGFFKKPKMQEQQLVEPTISQFFAGVEGISKTTIDKLEKAFESIRVLKINLLKGYSIDNLHIPAKQVEIIKQKIIQ